MLQYVPFCLLQFYVTTAKLSLNYKHIRSPRLIMKLLANVVPEVNEKIERGPIASENIKA